ncbi:MAG: hypothetical protein VYA66_06810, partial [SAR324 cluster bacterium]|nr:hypothetical protein [SAR324 cluster bacterium]
KDRRVKLVELTNKGASAFQTMVVEHEKWLINIFNDLNNEHLNMLVGSLNQLRKLTSHNSKIK